MRDSVGSFDAQNAHVRQAGLRNLSACTAHTADQSLGTEKIFMSILQRERGEKGTVATAEIHFEWSGAPEDAHKIDMHKIIFRNQLDLLRSRRKLFVRSHFAK
ncbi:MAG: hypothetical protein QOI04_1577 [Verrucomicrobiota bacterium]